MVLRLVPADLIKHREPKVSTQTATQQPYNPYRSSEKKASGRFCKVLIDDTVTEKERDK